MKTQSRALRAMRFALSICLAALAVAGPATEAAAREIGAVAAARNRIEGTPPTSASRLLRLSDRLIENERIVTGADAAGQFLFLDQTSLTVAPGSDITLDRYVYDPDSEAGEIGISIARGALRFIGGRISKTNDAVIRTPTASIGIRGGIALVSIDADGAAEIIHIAGDYTRVTSGGGGLTLSRANAVAFVPAPKAGERQAPKFTGIAGAGRIGAAYGALRGPAAPAYREARAPAPRPPEGGDAAATQTDGGAAPGTSDRAEAEAGGGDIRERNSGDPDAPFAQPISTSGERPRGGPSVGDRATETATRPAIRDPRLPGSGLAFDGSGDILASTVPDSGAPVLLPGLAGVLSTGFTLGDLFIDDFGLIAVADASFPFSEGSDAFNNVFDGSRIGRFSSEDGDILEFRVETADFEGFFPLNDSTVSITGDDANVSFSGGQIFRDSAADFTFGHGVVQEEGSSFSFSFLFAEPTPGQLNQVSGADVAVRRYDILPDATATFGPAFLPPGFGPAFPDSDRGEVVLVARPNGPLFTDVNPKNPDNTSKWAFAQLSIVGDGSSQRSLLMGGAANVTRMPGGDGKGGPSASMRISGAYSLDPINSDVGSITAYAGTGAGTVATAFGPGGEYFIFGNTAPHFTDIEPDIDIAANFLSSIFQSGAPSLAYGSTHILSLDSVEIATSASRGATGAPLSAAIGHFSNPSETDDPITVPARYERVFTGGYASASAMSFDGSTTSSTLLVSTGSNGVRMGFDADANTLGVGLTLEGQFITSSLLAGEQVFFGFGGSDRRSAYIDDGVFVAIEPLLNSSEFLPNTGLIDIGTSHTATPGRPAPQSATGHLLGLRGVVASQGLVGDGGVFPAGVDTDPDHLTWGWWSASFDYGPLDPLFPDRRDIFQPGAWISGDLSPSGAIPPTGTATFEGFALAHIAPVIGSAFVDGGRFTMNYDFALGGSGFVILDQFSEIPSPLIIPVTGATGPDAHFAGGLTGAQSIDTRGSFFSAPGQPVAAAGGSFDGTLTDGSGVVGVYGGDRQ